MIEELVSSFVKHIKVGSIDDRGYYICDEWINGGEYYLYNDGIIRSGVGGHNLDEGSNIVAFWKTKEEATAFMTEWVESRET